MDITFQRSMWSMFIAHLGKMILLLKISRKLLKVCWHWLMRRTSNLLLSPLLAVDRKYFFKYWYCMVDLKACESHHKFIPECSWFYDCMKFSLKYFPLQQLKSVFITEGLLNFNNEWTCRVDSNYAAIGETQCNKGRVLNKSGIRWLASWTRRLTIWDSFMGLMVCFHTKYHIWNAETLKCFSMHSFWR